MADVWRKCSTCKKDIFCGSLYQVCSVSTCRTHATNYAFCSVLCWDAHVPVERHRPESAGAIEKRAPRFVEEAREVRRIVVENETPIDQEILVVVSKVKKYIADKYDMNTSADVMKVLTKRIHSLCDRAVEEARRQSRKTVMDRDIP